MHHAKLRHYPITEVLDLGYHNMLLCLRKVLAQLDSESRHNRERTRRRKPNNASFPRTPLALAGKAEKMVGKPEDLLCIVLRTNLRQRAFAERFLGDKYASPPPARMPGAEEFSFPFPYDNNQACPFFLVASF